MISNSFVIVINIKVATRYDENCTLLFKIKFQVELKPKCEKQTTISKLPLGAHKCNLGIEI